MRIGQLAKAAGVGIDAVRFYEREGLLEEPARRPSGYREYGSEVVVHLQFIKGAKALGFSLKEIRELIALETDPRATAGAVMRIAEEKLANIEEKIRSLQRMRRALRKAVDECPGRGVTSGCSILRTLGSVGGGS